MRMEPTTGDDMEVNSSISDAIPSVIAEKRCASAFPDSILIILLQIHEKCE